MGSIREFFQGGEDDENVLYPDCDCSNMAVMRLSKFIELDIKKNDLTVCKFKNEIKEVEKKLQ